jgi:hypothetical protein
MDTHNIFFRLMMIFTHTRKSELGLPLFLCFFLQDETLRKAVQRFQGKNWKKIGSTLMFGLIHYDYI